MLISEIFAMVNEIAPFETAEPWDNVGLLTGRMENEVTGVLCALDVTDSLIEEAVRLGANTIVSHHPIMFSARKNLREDNYEAKMLCRIIRERINIIAAHTNYDKAMGGVNDCLAKELNIYNVRSVEGDEEGILRIGDIDTMRLGEFSDMVSNVLGDVVRVYGDRQKAIRRVAVCGGSGGEYASLAQKAGADAYVTGEMRYHDSMDLMQIGFATLHAGHDATERIAVKPLATGLQKRINALQYNVKVFLSNMGVVE